MKKVNRALTLFLAWVMLLSPIESMASDKIEYTEAEPSAEVQQLDDGGAAASEESSAAEEPDSSVEIAAPAETQEPAGEEPVEPEEPEEPEEPTEEEPQENVDLTEITVDAVVEAAALYDQWKNPTEPLSGVQRFLEELYGREATLRKDDGSARAVPLKLSVRGNLPEGVTAKLRYIEFDEEAVYSETALFGVDLSLYDAEGELYLPETPVTVTVSGPTVNSAIRDDSPMLVYIYEENTQREAAARVSYALDTQVYRDRFGKDQRRAYEVYDNDGNPIRFKEDRKGLTVYGNNTFTFEYDWTKKADAEAPLRFLIARQLSERILYGGAGDTAVAVYGAFADSVSVEVSSAAERSEETLLAVDISMAEEDAGSFQPDTPMAVAISDDLIAEAQADGMGVELWQIGADGGSELVEDAVVWDSYVYFETDALTEYEVVRTVLEKELTASDGNEYLVTVSYDSNSGIPENAELIVSEIKEGDKGYDEYVAESAETLDISAETVSFARAFDITLKDPETGEEYQPTKDVKVSIELLPNNLDESASVEVVHFGQKTEIMDATVNGEAVEFETSGFSVYVVIAHEGDKKVANARVEFHFIDRDFSLLSDGRYTASPYNFINKGLTNQTTQILTAGEALERISNPPTYFDGTSEKFFYGWYLVNLPEGEEDTADTTAYIAGTGKWEGAIHYVWPDDPEEISFEEKMTLTDENGNSLEDVTLKVGDTIKWTINGVSGTGILDSEGTVHAYLAPIYEDFYFVNFHMGSWNDPPEDGSSEDGSPEPLKNSLLAKRLVVFGADNKATVRISDIQCPSPDPTHQVFVGWQEYGNAAGQYYQTVDVNNGGSEFEYDLEITDKEKTSYDLYPVFAEARWLHFNTGKAGNGATYVPSQYLLTHDRDPSTFVNSLPISTRNGYNLEGWYFNAALDEKTGDIANLEKEVEVPVEQDGKIVDYTYHPAIRLTYGDGNFLPSVKGKVFYAKQSDILNHIVQTYMADSLPSGDDYVKLFEITADGKLYVYSGLDDMTLTACWTANTETTYKVVVWKQKVTDHKDEDDPEKKTYDFEVCFTSNPVPSNEEVNKTSFYGTYNYVVETNGVLNTQPGEAKNLNLTSQSAMNGLPGLAGDFTGFHYARTDMSGTPAPDGSTVYNVYYDRNLLTINWTSAVTGKEYTSTESTEEQPQQYGWVNGSYVKLTRVEDGIAHTYTYTPYTASNEQLEDMYGLEGGQYVKLECKRTSDTPETTATVYTKTNTLTAEKKYLIVSQGTAGTGYALGHDGSQKASDEVTVNAGTSETNGAVYIRDSDVNATSVWTVSVNESGKYTFKNGDYYVRFNNWALNISNQNSNNKWSWDGQQNHLYYTDTSSGGPGSGSQSNKYYLYYYSQSSSGYPYSGNGFTVDYYYQRSVYLYEKNTITETTTTTSYTYYYNNEPYNKQRYVKNDTEQTYTGIRYTDSTCTTPATGDGAGQWGLDENGVAYPLTYTSGSAYKWVYGEDGTVYTGTRYVVDSTSGTSGTVSKFTGLWGQNLSWYGYEWPSGYWYFTTGNKSRLTFLDAFLFDDLDNATDTNGDGQKDTISLEEKTGSTGNTVYFYKQNPDGTWPTETKQTVQVSENRFNITNKYNGFTASAYSTNNQVSWTYGKAGDNSFENASVPESGLHIRFARNIYSFTFDVNYPTGADAAVSFPKGKEKSANRTERVYYEADLSGFGYSTNGGITTWYYGVDDETNNATNELVAPDHYIFKGWYEDPEGEKPFNFRSNMPAANKIVYAKWEPETFWVQIDPNGAELDGAMGQPTYFSEDYGKTVGEYAVSRDYVPISDAAAETYDGQLYYYLNVQYKSAYDGENGQPASRRNALYIEVAGEGQSDDTEGADLLYDQRSELQKYYASYKASIINEGLICLDFDTWKKTYLSHQDPNDLNSDFQLYRKKHSNENYEFLGWFQVSQDSEGNETVASMPYVFTAPIDGPLKLRALWRLNGGYKVKYHADYSTSDGKLINGKMEAWLDPLSGSYADGAKTTIYKQPYAITINGVPTDEYIFRGFRKVTVTNTNYYTPMEPGVFYDPGDDLEISAADADRAGYIHMQAVYEAKISSYRRPYVTNLTLDANNLGYLTTGSKADVDGAELNLNTDLTTAFGWNGIGTVAATKTHMDDTGTHNVNWIEFGDIQTSQAIHLYRLATTLTNVGEGNPPGTNYFAHENNYFLLGFDNDEQVSNYIADYPADSVIAVTRDDHRTLYAVWEPMVYLNFVNNTDTPITFSLSSTDGALAVVNVKDGLYGRTTATKLKDIEIQPGGTLRYAVPEGKEKTVTVTVKNELGIGRVLTWDTSLTVDGETYNTATGSTAYQHAEGDTHELAKGSVDNTQTAYFNEKLIVNPEGMTVTFGAASNDYALVLESNYPEGGYQEYGYSQEEIAAVPPPSLELPSTSTRPGGYQFLGWAYTDDATEADVAFSATKPTGSPWTITNLNTFFSEHGTPDPTTGETLKVELYAVWKINNEASTVYIYNDVPLPGNRNEAFTFTLNIYGEYTYREVKETLNESWTFELYHDEYAVLESANNTEEGYLQTKVTVYKKDGTVKARPQTYTVQAKFRGNGGSFNNTERITVTQTLKDYYTTTVSKTAQTDTGTNPYYLYVGDSDAKTACPQTLATNTAYWTSTYAGGTLVFTNTRKTYNITVNKALTSYTTDSDTFTFDYSYTLDGDTANSVAGSFSVTSGTPNTTALKNMPAGAELTITERNDGSYETEIRSSTKGVLGEGPNDYDCSFTVEQNDTITFANTLKSYKVKFIKVDQDSKPTVYATFSLHGPGVVQGNDLYANSQKGGVFYESEQFWVGEYRLTETITPTGYEGLSPVTIHVTGDEENPITCNDNHVKIQKGENGIYNIYIINQQIVTITIQKDLSDPLLTSGARTFDFEVAYNYTLNETVISKSETVSVNSSNTVTGSEKIKVPVGAKLTVTEERFADSDAFNTVCKVTNDNATPVHETSGTEYTFDSVAASDNGDVLTFTNTRKTVGVTVHKVVTAEDTDKTFNFTATLSNGNTPIKEYSICGANKTDATYGTYEFTLGGGKDIVLTVPVGAKLTIQETGVVDDTTEEALENYSTSVAVTGTNNNDYNDEWKEDERLYTLTTVPSEDLTVTFTNDAGGKEVYFKKIDGYGNPLEGAQFSLYKDIDCKNPLKVNDEPLTATSSTVDGVKGTVVFERVPTGTWYMKESSDLNGYQKNTNTYVVVVGDEALKTRTDDVMKDLMDDQVQAQAGTGDDAVKFAIFLVDKTTHKAVAASDQHNAPDIATYGIMNISKVTRKVILDKILDTRVALPDAEFEIYRYDRTLVSSTDINGDTTTTFKSGNGGVYFVDDLPLGTYYIHETKLKDGTNPNLWWTLTIEKDGTFSFSDSPPPGPVETETATSGA